MKPLFALIALLLFHTSHAQLIKDIKRDIKGDAEWRLRRAVRDKVNDGIDSLGQLPKKSKNKKEQKKQEEQAKQGTTTAVSDIPGTADAGNGSEGYITLELSTPVISKGLLVTFNGVSIKHDKWKSVKLEIKAPGGTETVTVPMTDSGKYRLTWDQLLEEGDYVITATSSDGKATVSKRLLVTDWYQPQDETKDLMDRTIETYKKLKQKTEDVMPMLSSKDALGLKSKLAGVKDKLDALHRLLTSLGKAKREVGDLMKKGRNPTSFIRENLTELNRLITSKADEVEAINKITDHQASALTVCEYLAMLSEACAAFSTITNFFAKSVYGIIQNITIDKVIPKTVEIVNNNTGKQIGDETEWTAKEGLKIFASAKYDAEGFHSKLGKAGIAGDFIQFIAESIIKRYCGVYKGKVVHTYKLVSRNKMGNTWWMYETTVEGALVLRYPLNQSGGIIKMKGTIEGNATQFSFYADPDENPGYKAGTGGRIQTMIIKNYTPVSLPFASSLVDELGFGMLARLALTPAYFNIGVDAEYNTQTEEIQLFLSRPLVDFTDGISNLQFFVQWSAGLPILRMTDYPISKVKLTMNAAIKEDNTFNVKKDAKQTPFIAESVKRHIGDGTTARQHYLEFNVFAKKEN